ncbi:unnamed protein product, partial [Symbiodinium necroappetens]
AVKVAEAAVKGHPGKGNWWDSWSKEWEKDQQAQNSGLDRQTTTLLKALTKMALRHEDELSRVRPDSNFMMFIDVEGDHSVLPVLQQTAANWQEAFSAGTVTTSLRIMLFVGMMQQLQARLQDLMLQNQEQMDRLMAVGWLQQGATALNPVWPYYRWDAATKSQVISEQAPLTHDQVLHCVDALLKTACNPLVLLRFRAAKEMEEPESEVVPFLVSVSLRGQQAQDCFTALTTLSHNGVLKPPGLRLRPERLRKGPMAEAVEEATSWTDWKPRRNRLFSGSVPSLANHGSAMVQQRQPSDSLQSLVVLSFPVVDAGGLASPLPMDLAGQTIAVPVFDGPEGISTSHQAFYVAYTIIHHGDTTTAGLLMRLIFTPLGLMTSAADAQTAEHLLIHAFRALLPAEGTVTCPPNLALAARNDIVAIAQDLLSDAALPVFLRYADELAHHLQGETRVTFPPLPRAATESSTPAEACAEAHLLEGSGALWTAIRQVATLLPFRDDRRPHGNGRMIAFGAFNKGGLLGIHKHTTCHQAVCTLLNAAVRAVSAQHCWTTLVLTYNSHTTPHYDKGNCEGVTAAMASA